MPRRTKRSLNITSEYNCGPLIRQEDDEEVLPGTQPEEILSKITLLCDDRTRVLFFRYDHKLYLRIVEQASF